MAGRQSNGVLNHLRQVAMRKCRAGLTDGELLERFITRRDEAAFEALVRWHGPMVLGVCRRVLRHTQDAEDAFQATFLVLVRKAASVRPRAMVGNWLYGVAHNTARKAKAMNLRRCQKERVTGTPPERAAPAEVGWELEFLLDRELLALPDKYRAPIVLCDLEGKSLREAARLLGCPPGTVASRLSRGRARLARRLARYGSAMSAGAVAAALSQRGAACVPPSLVFSTTKAAMSFAVGSAAAGAVSAPVAALTAGVLKAMLLTRLKTATAVAMVLVLAGLGAVLPPLAAQAQRQAPAVEAARKEGSPGSAGLRRCLEGQEWILSQVNAAKRTLDIRYAPPDMPGVEVIPAGPGGKLPTNRLWMSGLALEGLAVAKAGQVLIDGEEGRLGDLKAGMRLRLSLTKDRLAIARILATTRVPSRLFYRLDAVDAEQGTITVTAGDMTFDLPVAQGAAIYEEFADFKSKPEVRHLKLTDLKAGVHLLLHLAVESDRVVAKSIRVSR
jgi:RNA polymerase sigma factor (sigma-70 family)